MDFIRTVVHGVRDIRSRVRKTGTGRMADAGPPVITIIDHKPGFYAAYGIQTVICALLIVSGIGGIVYVAALRPSAPLSAADLLFVAFGSMILIGALLPVYFVRSFHQLQRVFDAAEEHHEHLETELDQPADTAAQPADAPAPTKDKGYETDEEITEAALAAKTPLTGRYPNMARFTDPAWIMLTAVMLMATGALQLVSGTYLSFTFDGSSGAEEIIFDGSHTGWLIFGIGQLSQSIFNVTLGVLVTRHNPWSPALGLLLALINLGLAVTTGHPFWIGLAAIAVFLLGLATLGFRSMNKRIATVDKSDALEVYYHNLMLALVHVMRADGQCDRAELGKITRLCNNMNLSAYEQYVVQRAANTSGPEPIESVASRYLEAAGHLGLAEPELSLLLCGYAVAAADGGLVTAEVAALKELAGAMDAKPAKILNALTELKSLEGLTAERARALLDLEADSTAAELDAAYERLSTMLGELSFDHLGQPMVDIVQGHLAALKRAYNLLKQAPDAAG